MLAPFDPATGRLDPAAVIDLIDERTRWVAVTGASNLLGTIPDLAPIVAAAHDAGARVFVDAVHLAPHRRSTSPPSAATSSSPARTSGTARTPACCAPTRRCSTSCPSPRSARPPTAARAAGRPGTPSFEAIAAVDAAAAFLLDVGLDALGGQRGRRVRPAARRAARRSTASRVWGPPTMEGRTPTVAFTVDGHHPDAVAAALAAERIATWAGHSYAVEVVDQLGLADTRRRRARRRRRLRRRRRRRSACSPPSADVSWPT